MMQVFLFENKRKKQSLFICNISNGIYILLH
jgi:hypothetical protein